MSLIELVVAMAIFALIAVMGVQSLSGMLRMRDRLVAMDDKTAALGQTLGLLRNDLSAVMPMVFFPPGRAAPQSAIRLTDGSTRLAFSVAGQPDLKGVRPGGRIERVEWRLDQTSATLHRRAWQTLIPASPQALSPEIAVMNGVTGMTVRSFWPGAGWQTGIASPFSAAPVGSSDGDVAGGAPEVYSDLIPSAIEVTLVTESHGSLRLLETLK
ncbi:hypothetical protein H9Q16_13485 [Sulfitobacter sp. TSTF-M16]|uniref:Type II secretion system protein J n=2 Tax=Sulfitobacter aestuariivivens TaxID=2766981 RepID=A0A927D4Q2_9RHOB|nr:hypothetical protein [Sulfitobacter aestuariivivens]